MSKPVFLLLLHLVCSSDASENQVLSLQDSQEAVTNQLRQTEAENECLVGQLQIKQDWNATLETRIVSYTENIDMHP